MLGILDWGIGGLGVYRALRSRGDTREVLYFSDSGAPPYGTLEAAQLKARLGEVSALFEAQGVTEVLVACNAASAALEGEDTRFGKVLLRTIVPAAVKCVEGYEGGSLGVIGGRLTIGSGLYQRALGRSARFETAQPLSALVESGQLDGANVESAVKEVLARVGQVDALLLACTHYPALAPVFQRLAPATQLLDPAEHFLPLHAEAGSGHLTLLTSGDLAATLKSAQLAFGVAPSEATRT